MQTQRKINGLQKQYYQFCDRAGLEPQMERARVKGYHQISTQGLDFDEKSGIISRKFAFGLRKPPTHILNAEEIESVKEAAREIGIDEKLLRFNTGAQTGFVETSGLINIRGNVLPDPFSTKARDRMSVRAVLAHEYYGHFMNHPSPYPIDSWEDEFRASYDAAIRAPNLSREERADLMVDAYDRAQEAGNRKEYSEEAKAIIYGFNSQ